MFERREPSVRGHVHGVSSFFYFSRAVNQSLTSLRIQSACFRFSERTEEVSRVIATSLQRQALSMSRSLRPARDLCREYHSVPTK